MPETLEQPAGAYPESPLTARLARRAREPLGVIDVRHPEHLGTRGTAWMGQRLEMLDRWKTRYGLAAPEAPPEPAPVSAASSFVMRAALPRAQPVPEPPAPAQFRVKRPDEVRGAAPAAGNRAEPAGPLVHDAPLSLRVGELVAAYAGDPLIPALRHRGEDAELPRQASFAARAPVQPTEPTLPQPPHGSQAAAPSNAAVSSAAPGPPQGISATPVNAATPALVLRRKVSDDSKPVARAVASTAASGLPVAQGKPAGVLVQTGELVQKRTVGPSPSALILPSRATAKAEEQTPTSATTFAEPRVSRGAVAAEIPAARTVIGAAPIVWRRTDSGDSSRSLSPPVSSAPNLQIMRTPSGASSAQSVPMAPSNIPALQSSSGGANVGHLADQVSRLIARQLTVERERRGLTR